MKHHKAIRKLGRVSKQRKSLLISLATSLILEGKIRTTEAKAKELRPFVEKIITKSRENNLACRRLIISRLGNSDTVAKKLFEEIAPKYKEREGGYTRIVKLSPRLGDGSPMAIIEFI